MSRPLLPRIQPLSRRAFVRAGAGLAGASLVLGGWPTSAAVEPFGGRRLVVVFLRGGLDGLAAVPAPGDPHYARARGPLAEIEGLAPLDATFALHPALAPLLPLYRSGELLAVHALASRHRDRSHFDAQNLIENGTEVPYAAPDGWLNRVLAGATEGAAGRRLGLALGHGVPLLIRGEVQVATWAPSTLPRADADFLDRLADLYAADPLLAPALAAGLSGDAMADGEGMARGALAARRGATEAFRLAMTTAGGLLRSAQGPRIAALDLGNFDTHAGELQRLALLLPAIPAGLLALKEALGPAWASTAVLLMSEFGRTVAGNGTGGSDHGTAGMALLAGGAVAGGRVVADWPGLAAHALFEGRDLRPTLETRALFKGVLRDHLGLTDDQLARRIFPDSAAVASLPGLFRA